MNMRNIAAQNAAWTRHEQARRPAPQVRPLVVLTKAGQEVTGVCWLNGRPLSGAGLCAALNAAVAAVKAGDTSAAYQEVKIQPAPGALSTVLRFIDIKQFSEVRDA